MLFDNPPEEWNVTTLGEVCSQGGGGIQTGPFGSQLHASDYVDEGIPSIMPANIGDNRISEEGIARITKEDADRLSKYLVQDGDIVYSRRGDVEKCALVRKHEDGWLCGTGCLRVRPGNGVVDPLFCSYFLSHPESREWISRHAVGATMPNLNTQILSEVPFLLPIRTEQKAIARILGTLDDKIELNRKTNETLEDIAKALFKSWFVDFDPVRAKAEGRPTGLPDEVSELFSDSFEESELGEIPSGWNIKSIGDVAEVIDCLHSKKPEKLDEGSLMLQLNNIRDDGLLDVGDQFLISDSDYQKWTSRMEAREGDCVVTNVGRVGAVAQIPEGLKAALGRNMTGVRGKHTFKCHTFILEYLLSPLGREEIRINIDEGTILNALNVKSIPKLRFALPSGHLLEKYEVIGRSFRRRMEMLLVENSLLCDLRDALLPRLISGELRVPDAEKMLEEVGI